MIVPDRSYDGEVTLDTDGRPPEPFNRSTVMDAETFDFGEGVRRLKAGRRVARAGWNGKGMWLVLLQPGGAERDAQPALAASYLHVATTPCGTVHLRVDPCIAMRTAGASLQPGWLASQADILGEDWVEVP